MTLPQLPLRDLPIGTFQLVKETVAWFGTQDHTRWVFRVPRRCGVLVARTTWYAKIWNATYVRSDNVLRALDAGFYDDQTTPALAALIVHQGVCRGYLTYACRPCYVLDPAYHRVIMGKTRSTGLFNVQFSRYHVMKFGRRSTLIDLEGIYPIEDAARMSEFHCSFDDPDYEAFVNALSRGERPPDDVSASGLGASSAPIGRLLWRVARHPMTATQAIVAHNRYRFASHAHSSRPHHVHLLER